MSKEKLPIPKKMELGFDFFYLITASVMGIILAITWNQNVIKMLWASMAFILVFGDGFHLVPRMRAAASGKQESYRKAMGIGKMLTSITMSIFYLFLWQIGLMLFSGQGESLSIFVWIAAVLRILLCLMPQNKWTQKEENNRWGIYRNIPFLIEGALVLWLFATYGLGTPFYLCSFAILFSFLFYIPVVLFSYKNPKLGMLMLPKTLAYLWIISMGFLLKIR